MRRKIILVGMLLLTTTSIRADMCGDYVAAASDELINIKACRDTVKNTDPDIIASGVWGDLPPCVRFRASAALLRMKFNAMESTLEGRCGESTKREIVKIASELDAIALDLKKLITPSTSQQDNSSENELALKAKEQRSKAEREKKILEESEAAERRKTDLIFIGPTDAYGSTYLDRWTHKSVLTRLTQSQRDSIDFSQYSAYKLRFKSTDIKNSSLFDTFLIRNGSDNRSMYVDERKLEIILSNLLGEKVEATVYRDIMAKMYLSGSKQMNMRPGANDGPMPDPFIVIRADSSEKETLSKEIVKKKKAEADAAAMKEEWSRKAREQEQQMPK